MKDQVEVIRLYAEGEERDHQKRGKGMRIVFFGNGFEYSLSMLQVLLMQAQGEVVGVVSPVSDKRSRAEIVRKYGEGFSEGREPQRRLGVGAREQLLLKMRELAKMSGAELLWPGRVNSREVLEALGRWDADLGVIAGFDQILKRSVLEKIPKVINVHPSLLPEYRGSSPEFWIVSNGELRSGVTVHVVDEGIDTGPIIAQRQFEVEPWLTCGELQTRSIEEGGALLGELLGEDGDWCERAQEGDGSYYRSPVAEDLSLPFWLSSEAVFDRWRASTPWGLMYTHVLGGWEGLKDREVAKMSRNGGEGKVRLRLDDAVPFAGSRSEEQVGTLRRSGKGAAAVCSGGGVVYFRKVLLC